MNTKEQILRCLRKNTAVSFDMPHVAIAARVFDDPVGHFVETATTSAGAKVLFRKKGDDLNQKIHEAYPDARTIASNVPGVTAQMNPDAVKEAQALDGTDVGVVRGGVACAENACVWVPQTMKEKAVCFISECLVIIISEKDIVSNMHEAYERLSWNDYGFGTFISGPSKTADIEQALVYGAQAAKSVTIIVEEE